MSDAFRGFAAALKSDWRALARPEQMPPPGEWTSWVFCAGRGAGKTRSGAEWVRERVEAGTAKRIHLVAPTAADCRDVMIEGASGLLSVFPQHLRPTYLPSLRKVEFSNGAVALLFSSDEPDRLRGPQCDTLWIDELCAMRRPQEVLDMGMLGLRLSRDPRCLITTTPRPIKCFKQLLSRDGTDVIVTRCSTMANAENLARPFLSQIMQQYQGTRLGRQELNAELLLDVPGALWTIAMLDDTRVNEPPAQFQRIVIGVDPAGSSAEWADQSGIVVAALGHDDHAYILADASGRYTPAQWARIVVDLYHEYRADRIVVERNFGGDMAEHTIRSVDPSVSIKPVTSSRGKVLRAEPIAAYFEQRRAHIVGSLPALEDQLTNFTHHYDRSKDGSPDRLDAAVFALTELMSTTAAPGYFRESALLVNGEPPPTPQRVDKVFAVPSVSTTDSVAVIYFAACETQEVAYPLMILDWEIVEAEIALTPDWLAAILNRLQTLVPARLNRAPLIVEPSPFGQVMLEFASVYDLDVALLDNLGSPDRATAARGYVSTGAVKVCRPAYEKIALHRGVTRNHLMSQLLAFDPESKDAQEFVAAFCTAVIGELPGRRVSALPSLADSSTASDVTIDDSPKPWQRPGAIRVL